MRRFNFGLTPFGMLPPAVKGFMIGSLGIFVVDNLLNHALMSLFVLFPHSFWNGFQVATGVDYLRDKTYQELAQTGRIWVPEMIFKGWAPFLQVEQRLLDDRLRLSAGGRYENVELDVPDFTSVARRVLTAKEGLP